MRSRDKEVKERIREHILRNLSTDETTDTQEQLQDVVNAFYNWYGAYERRVQPNLQAAFIDWLKGLPSELSPVFYYWDQRKALNRFFDTSMYTDVLETPGTNKWKNDDEIENLYYHLFYREFAKLCDKYKVDKKGVIV